MRKLFILCAFLLQLLSPVYPQQATTATIEPNLKYGKPSKEELSLTSYAPDTTATAIYLFHQGQSDFIYHDGFQLTTEHWVRIKILNHKECHTPTCPFPTTLLPIKMKDRKEPVR